MNSSANTLSMQQNGRSVDEVDEVKSSPPFTVEMMSEILISGSDNQRMVILFELQQLLSHCFEETTQTLVPVLCRLVPKWPSDLQVSAAEALMHVAQKQIPGHTSKQICDAAFDVITQTRTAEMFEAWGEILVVILPTVAWNGENEISTVISILDDFTVSPDEVCRKLVARVLGSFSSCLSTAEVEAYVMMRALQLADDPDVEVRGMVSESLAFIGQVVDVQVIESHIWPRLLSLLADADARIHAATLKTIAHIASVHKQHSETSKLYSELLPPVFAAECKYAKNAGEKDQRIVDDDTYLLLEIISQVFGPFVHAVHPHLRDEADKRLAFNAFLSMATCNGPVVRRYCAFNFPGISKSLAHGFQTELAAIANFLSRDADPETRWNLAAGMHETTRILMGKDSAQSLFITVTSLLQDENALVRTNALEHLFELISALTEETNTSNSDAKIESVFQNLNVFSRGNWRTQELLAKQLEKVCPMIPITCLRDIVLPLLFEMAEESTYLVRKAAMAAIAKSIWCLSFSEEGENVLRTFTSTWAEGAVYWMRTAFVECAERACSVYSSKLFIASFLKPLLLLAYDGVHNVRLRLARATPLLAPLCFDDEEYQRVLEHLRNDEDVDVKQAMKSSDDRIAHEMRDRASIRAEEERRIAEENKLQEKLHRKRTEGRRRGGKGKSRASTLKLAKVRGSSSHKSHNSPSFENENTSHTEPGSPVSVMDVPGNEDQQETSTSQNFIRRILSGEKSTSGRAANDPLQSPRRKSLRVALGRVADDTPNLASPTRRLKKILSGGREDGSATGNRRTFKNLLSHVGSGFKSKQQAAPNNAS